MSQYSSLVFVSVRLYFVSLGSSSLSNKLHILRVRAPTPGNTPGIVGATLNQPPLQSTLNQHLCQTCQNRHTCRVLKNCEACSKWCDDSPTTLQSRFNLEETDFPLVSLSEGVLKDSITNLLGVENAQDVDRLKCSVSTRSGKPPGINADQQRVLNDPQELFEHVRRRIKENLMGRVKEQEVNCLSTEDIERLLDDILRNVTSSTKQDSLISSSRASFSEPIIPNGGIKPLIIPQVVNPPIIEGTLDPTKMENPQLAMESPSETIRSPSEPMGSPIETMESPSETMRSPSESMEGSVDPMGRPIESMGSPNEPMEGSVEPMGSPIESMGSPSEPMENQREAMESPSDTIRNPSEPMESPIEPKPMESPMEPVSHLTPTQNMQNLIAQIREFKAQESKLRDRLKEKAPKASFLREKLQQRSGSPTQDPIEAPTAVKPKDSIQSVRAKGIPLDDPNLERSADEALEAPTEMKPSPNVQAQEEDSRPRSHHVLEKIKINKHKSLPSHHHHHQSRSGSEELEVTATPIETPSGLNQQIVESSLNQEETTPTEQLAFALNLEETPRPTEQVIIGENNPMEAQEFAPEANLEETPSEQQTIEESDIIPNNGQPAVPNLDDPRSRTHHLLQKLKAKKHRKDNYPYSYQYGRSGSEDQEPEQQSSPVASSFDQGIPGADQQIAETPEEALVKQESALVDPGMNPGNTKGTPQLLKLAEETPAGEETPLETQGSKVATSISSEKVETPETSDSKSGTHHLIQKLKAKKQRIDPYNRYPYSRSGDEDLESVTQPLNQVPEEITQESVSVDPAIHQEVAEEMPVHTQLVPGEDNLLENQETNVASTVSSENVETPEIGDSRSRTHHLIQKLKAKKQRIDPYNRYPYSRSGDEDLESRTQTLNQVPEEITQEPVLVDPAMDQEVAEENSVQTQLVPGEENLLENQGTNVASTVSSENVETPETGDSRSRTHHLIQKLKAKKQRIDPYNRYPYSRSGDEDLESVTQPLNQDPEEITQESASVDPAMNQEVAEENPVQTQLVTGQGNLLENQGTNTASTASLENVETPETGGSKSRTHHLIQKLKSKKQRIDPYNRYPYSRSGDEDLESVTQPLNQDPEEIAQESASIDPEVAQETPQESKLTEEDPETPVGTQESILQPSTDNLGSEAEDLKSRTHHLLEKLKAKKHRTEKYPLYYRSGSEDQETVISSSNQAKTDETTSSIEATTTKEEITEETPETLDASQLSASTDPNSRIPEFGFNDPKSRAHHLIQKLKAKTLKTENNLSSHPYSRSGSENLESAKIDPADPGEEDTTVRMEDASLGSDPESKVIDDLRSRTHQLLEKLKSKKYSGSDGTTEAFLGSEPEDSNVFLRDNQETGKHSGSDVTTEAFLGSEPEDSNVFLRDNARSHHSSVHQRGKGHLKHRGRPYLRSNERSEESEESGLTEVEDIPAVMEQIQRFDKLQDQRNEEVALSRDNEKTEEMMEKEAEAQNLGTQRSDQVLQPIDDAAALRDEETGFARNHKLLEKIKQKKRKGHRHRSNEQSEESEEILQEEAEAQNPGTQGSDQLLHLNTASLRDGAAADFARNHKLLEKIKQKKKIGNRHRSSEDEGMAEEELPKNLSARTHQLMENIKEKLNKFNRNNDGTEQPDLGNGDMKQLLSRHGTVQEGKDQPDPNLEETLQQIETLMKNLERTLPPQPDQKDILGSQPLESSLEVYSLPTHARSQPKPYGLLSSQPKPDDDLIGSANEGSGTQPEPGDLGSAETKPDEFVSFKPKPEDLGSAETKPGDLIGFVNTDSRTQPKPEDLLKVVTKPGDLIGSANEESRSQPEPDELVVNFQPKLDDLGNSQPKPDELVGFQPKPDDMLGFQPKPDDLSGLQPKLDDMLGFQPKPDDLLGFQPKPGDLTTPKPKPGDLANSPHEDDMYFISNGIKLPLRQVKKGDGAVHLAIDLDRLCSCNNITCNKGETLEKAVGSILGKENLGDDLDFGDVPLGSPHLASRFLGDSGEIQHENSGILKRSPNKNNIIPKEQLLQTTPTITPTTNTNPVETTSLDSLSNLQKSSKNLKLFLTNKLSELRSKLQPPQKSNPPMFNRFQSWLQSFDSAPDSNVLLPLTKKEESKLQSLIKTVTPNSKHELTTPESLKEFPDLKLLEKELRDKMGRIDEYNRVNGEIIRRGGNAAEGAILREEIGIMGNFLKWLKGVVNSNNGRVK